MTQLAGPSPSLKEEFRWPKPSKLPDVDDCNGELPQDRKSREKYWIYAKADFYNIKESNSLISA